jgi:PilZ domain-containing protein
MADPESDRPAVDVRQSGEIDDRRKAPERRRASRRKVLKAGKTFWPNGDSSECSVYNLSESGAQLEICGPVPNLFELLIEGDPLRRSCSVVWRRANRAGVKFNEQSRFVMRRKGLANPVRECMRFAEMCRTMAERSISPDREHLLEMAAAWLTVIRYVRKRRQLMQI